MNPDTNKFEKLIEGALADENKTLENAIEMADRGSVLVRPDGSPVPKHWSVFTVGEEVVIKDYTFKVAYIGETAILFEPVGPILLNEKEG